MWWSGIHENDLVEIVGRESLHKFFTKHISEDIRSGNWIDVDKNSRSWEIGIIGMESPMSKDDRQLIGILSWVGILFDFG